MRLERISRAEFLHSECIVLISAENPKCFARIELGNGLGYLISWESVNVDPDTLEMRDKLFFIGIDTQYVLFDAISQNVIFEESRSSYLSMIIPIDLSKCALVFETELQILRLGEDVSIDVQVESFYLPDLVEEWSVVGDFLDLKLYGGSSMRIEH